MNTTTLSVCDWRCIAFKILARANSAFGVMLSAEPNFITNNLKRLANERWTVRLHKGRLEKAISQVDKILMYLLRMVLGGILSFNLKKLNAKAITNVLSCLD